jgi:hypothetical protein
MITARKVSTLTLAFVFVTMRLPPDARWLDSPMIHEIVALARINPANFMTGVKRMLFTILFAIMNGHA